MGAGVESHFRDRVRKITEGSQENYKWKSARGVGGVCRESADTPGFWVKIDCGEFLKPGCESRKVAGFSNDGFLISFSDGRNLIIKVRITKGATRKVGL